MNMFTNKFFIIEVPQYEMEKMFKDSPTAGFYFTNTDNRRDINQFLNNRFSTIYQQYEFFIHECDLDHIRKHDMTLFPVYYGHGG